MNSSLRLVIAALIAGAVALVSMPSRAEGGSMKVAVVDVQRVVMQTEDAGFNAWALASAERNRHLERPPRPVVLVHIRELRPPQSRIVRAEAELRA